jgi:hypothetical protein
METNPKFGIVRFILTDTFSVTLPKEERTPTCYEYTAEHGGKFYSVSFIPDHSRTVFIENLNGQGVIQLSPSQAKQVLIAFMLKSFDAGLKDFNEHMATLDVAVALA